MHLNIKLWDLYNFILKRALSCLYSCMKIYCLVSIWWRLSYSFVYLSIQVWLSDDEVVRVALRYEGTYPVIFFSLMKVVRDGTSGDNFLGSKDLIYQPVMSMFSWTIPIQVFPKLGRFPHQSSFLLELLLNCGIWYTSVWRFFILHLCQTPYSFYETLFTYII